MTSLADVIKARIEANINGCVSVDVKTVDASSGKYAVVIVASAFQGVPLIQRHRAVQGLFEKELQEGTIHALEINAKPPPPPPAAAPSA
jgi:stress-induced morphogen